MSRYTLADRLIGYRSATPLAYNQFGAKPAADQLHRMPPGPRPRAAGQARGMYPPLPPTGDPDAAEPLHAGRPDGPAARVVGGMSRPEFEISTDWTGHAKPGHWYGRYYDRLGGRTPRSVGTRRAGPGWLLQRQQVGWQHAELGRQLVQQTRSQDAQRCALHSAQPQHDAADGEAEPQRHRGDAPAVQGRLMAGGFADRRYRPERGPDVALAGDHPRSPPATGSTVPVM
jgi:hypothetical protein